jgi:hypothetical protein
MVDSSLVFLALSAPETNKQTNKTVLLLRVQVHWLWQAAGEDGTREDQAR